MTPRLRHWAADTAERTASTAAQALIATVGITGWTSSDTWAITAGAAALCVLKCVAALNVGAPDSASLLPADQDPPQ